MTNKASAKAVTPMTMARASRSLISAAVISFTCGVRIAEIEDPLMLEVRYLDKLIDELAKGKAMAKILRS